MEETQQQTEQQSTQQSAVLQQSEQSANQQATAPAPKPQVSATVDVNGIQVDRNELINLVVNQYDGFFNTYKDMWSGKQLRRMLEQRDALINNLRDGNIVSIGTNNVNMLDPNASGMDLTTGGPGQINIGYLSKIGNWMTTGIKAKKKKWNSSTMNQGWLTNFFGGSSTPDYQSWIDLDEVDKKTGKRGTAGRIAALSNWINSINPDDYVMADGTDANDVKAKLTRLKTALNDGVLNNEDYAAASALGFNLRTILSDDITSANAGATSDGTGDSGDVDESQMDDATYLQHMWQGDPQKVYKEIASKIRGWQDVPETVTHIGRADMGANAYLTYRNQHDRTGTYNVKDGNAEAAYYAGTFFPKFFQQFQNDTFSPEYMYKHINDTVNTWEGKISKYKYIALNLTLAINNKLYGDGKLLGSYASLLNPLLDTAGNQTGFWTVPGSFNENTGTEYVYNPDTGEFKRISLRNKKYQYLLRDYMKSQGIDFSTPDTSSQQNASLAAVERNGGKIEMHQYGGSILPQTYSTSKQVDYGLFSYLPYETTTQPTNADGSPAPQTPEQIEKLRQAQYDKFWNGNGGKHFEGASDFWNKLTPQDKRELEAGLLDLSAIGINFVPGANVVSVVPGLGATYLRAKNRFEDDKHFSLEDAGWTAVDAGMSLAGIIPYVGAAAKAGSLARTLGKTAKLIMQGLGAMGLIQSFKGGYSACNKILNNQMPTTAELQSLAGGISALMGWKQYSHNKAKSDETIANSARNGHIVENSAAKPEQWTFKFKTKKPDGTYEGKQVHFTSKSDAEDMKKALAKNDADAVLGLIKKDSNFSTLKKEDLSFNPLSAADKAKAKLSDNVGDLSHSKAQEAGQAFIAYENPKTIQEKLWNASVKLGRYKFKMPSLKSVFSDNRAQIIADNMPGSPSRTAESGSASAHSSGSEGSSSSSSSTSSSTGSSTGPSTGSSTGGSGAPAPSGSRASITYSSRTLDMMQKVFKVDPSTKKSTGIDSDALKNLWDQKRALFTKRITPEEAHFIDNAILTSGTSAKKASERKKVYDILAKVFAPYNKISNKDEAIKAAKSAMSSIIHKNGGTIDKLDTGGNLGFSSGTMTQSRSTPYGGIDNTNGGTDFNWNGEIFEAPGYQDTILDLLKKRGDEAMNELNNSQHSHSQIFGKAGGRTYSFIPHAYNGSADEVRKYQEWYGHFGQTGDGNFNNIGILNGYNLGRYKNQGYDVRNGADSLKTKWNPDGSYSGYTDDRRMLGRMYDFTDLLLADWNKKLAEVGYEQYLDTSDNYYKLRQIQKPTSVQGSDVKPKDNIDITGILNGMGPAVLGALRVGNDNAFNNRMLKNHLEHTHTALYNPVQFTRKIYGDYAAKQGYANQAAQGQNIASRIAGNISDASIGMATMMQGAQNASEMNAKGNMADNQQIAKTYEQSLALDQANAKNRNDVSNTNNKNLIDLEREKLAAIEATKKTNHDNWSRYYQGYIEKPLMQKFNERKAMQQYLLYAGMKALSDSELAQKTLALQQQYYAQYNAAATEEDKAEIIAQAKQDMAKLQAQSQSKFLYDLAKSRGIQYNYYHPEWSLSGIYTPPVSTATPTTTGNAPVSKKETAESVAAKKAKGGILIAITAVKEKNKDNDRLSKLWQKSMGRFARQFAKLKQSDYTKMIKF